MDSRDSGKTINMEEFDRVLDCLGPEKVLEEMAAQALLRANTSYRTDINYQTSVYKTIVEVLEKIRHTKKPYHIKYTPPKWKLSIRRNWIFNGSDMTFDVIQRDTVEEVREFFIEMFDPKYSPYLLFRGTIRDNWCEVRYEFVPLIKPYLNVSVGALPENVNYLTITLYAQRMEGKG